MRRSAWFDGEAMDNDVRSTGHLEVNGARKGRVQRCDIEVEEHRIVLQVADDYAARLEAAGHFAIELRGLEMGRNAIALIGIENDPVVFLAAAVAFHMNATVAHHDLVPVRFLESHELSGELFHALVDFYGAEANRRTPD